MRLRSPTRFLGTQAHISSRLVPYDQPILGEAVDASSLMIRAFLSLFCRDGIMQLIDLSMRLVGFPAERRFIHAC